MEPVNLYRMIEDAGGKVDEPPVRLPDGSGFLVASSLLAELRTVDADLSAVERVRGILDKR